MTALPWRENKVSMTLYSVAAAECVIVQRQIVSDFGLSFSHGSDYASGWRELCRRFEEDKVVFTPFQMHEYGSLGNVAPDVKREGIRYWIIRRDFVINNTFHR